MRLIRLLLCFFSITFLASGLARTNENSGLGLNLTGISYWSSQWMLLDVMKQASNGSGQLWATSNANTYEYNTGHQSRLDLDSAGWPRSLPASNDPDFHFVTTIIYHDNEHNISGDFTVLYEGEGRLEYIGPTLIESSSGRDVIRLSKNQFFHLRITETDPNKNGNHIRNVRIIVPGGSCSASADDYAQSASVCDQAESYVPFETSYADRVFHPLFIQDIKGFRTLRFMQFLSTINNPQVNWDERPKFNYASWGLEAGSPYELAILLANKTNTEPWLNLPVRVSDDYMQNFALLVKSTLKDDLNFYLEFGNEIWNNAWPYNLDGAYLSDQGRLRWQNVDGQELNYRLNFYGMRSQQMCQFTKHAFLEQANRVNCVIGGQTGVPWIAEQALSCPYYAQETESSGCAEQIDVLAVGNYFAGYFADVRYVDILQSWSANPVQGVSNLFEELERGLLRELTYNPNEPEWWQAPQHGALRQAKDMIAGNLALAKGHNLMLAAYESGQHFTYAGDSRDGRDQITRELFLAANKDSRMAGAYLQYLTDWIDAGGGLNILFESTGRWDDWGAFPLKEFQLQNDSVKFNEVQKFIEIHDCWWINCDRNLTAPSSDGHSENGNTPDEPTTYSITISAESIVDTMGVKLSWESNIPNSILFKLYRDEILVWQGKGVEYSEHWLSLRKNYHYQLKAEVNGQSISSNSITVQAGDSIAPSPITNLTVNESDGKVVLNWHAAEDNIAIAGYKIFRNGKSYGWQQSNSFVDFWPIDGQIIYEVIAVDTSENNSVGQVIIYKPR